MIAKITKGSSFGGCIRYVMNKKDAQLIDARGVLLDNTRTITDSFEDQAKMNPRLEKIVGHISLNFSVQDIDKMTNAFMVKVAQGYMQQMGITDTQFIIVRHNDREHPHCHIVYNRVSNSGKTISDQNDRLRSVKTCKALTKKHDLYIKRIDGKQNVNREQLRGQDKIKYEIFDAIKASLPLCSNWDQLQKRLEENGVSVAYKYNGSTDEKQGVIFSKDGQSFNGSKVDRQFSYSKLDTALNENARNLENKQAVQRTVRSKSHENQSQTYSWPTENSHRHDHSIGSVVGGLFDITPGPAEEPDDSLLWELRKKKKKPKKGRKM